MTSKSNKHQSKVVIVNGARTPMGSFQGSLSALSAPELGAITTKAALERSGLAGEQIEDVIFGCVLAAGLKQGPARQAALLGGVPESVGCTTVNKLCGSGMKAVMMAHDMIQLGVIQLALAGGMESMTNAPYIVPKVRAGLRMGHGELKDHMFLDGLEDAATGKLMGAFAQDMANQRDITRDEMDAFAIESLRRAQYATQEGLFTAEITPCSVVSRKGTQTVTEDEQPKNANIEKIPQLRPAFAKDGTVTAANSSSISDGAAALVLAHEDSVQAQNLQPLAKIVGQASFARHPSEFTIAPVGAIQRLLDQTGWRVADVDLWEINEAFAMVTLAAMREFKLDHSQVNVHGGACALGHPVGATGARIILTLIHALRQQGKRKGIAALCIGGGEATAIAIEVL